VIRLLVYPILVAAILAVGSSLVTLEPRRPPVRVAPGIARGTFDENAYYRLTTLWQGTGKSLGIGPRERSRITVRLVPTADDPGQHWKLTPVPGGHYRLTTRGLGEEMSLEGFDDDRGNSLALRPAPARPGDGWKIVAVGGGHYRLLPGRLGDGWSLDIANDGRGNDRPVLAPTGDYSGQAWRIAPVP
jgi:hypothetical protein